jgi:hypothetical protein
MLNDAEQPKRWVTAADWEHTISATMQASATSPTVVLNDWRTAAAASDPFVGFPSEFVWHLGFRLFDI